MNAPGRTPAIPRQSPMVRRELPQPLSKEEVDNASPPINASQPTKNSPIPVKHFEPNPLFEVPQPDPTPQIAQETSSQKPVLRTEGSSANQDPWDTQMEVPFSEEIVEPVFKRPEMTDFEIPPVLEEMIPDGALIHKHLPRQADIDRIMIQINRKYLKKMHLPFSLKDMQAAYMQSPHFCDIYNVMFNRYPKCKRAIEKLQQAMLSQYMVQGGLLYIYLKNNFGEHEPILCVPPSKIDVFLDQYHTSLLGGHSGITKCYQTLKQRIYCPNLPYYVRLYIISCHICQLFKGSKRFDL